MIPESVKTWLQVHGHGDLVAIQSVGGGCINNSIRIECKNGRSFFLKTNLNPPREMFAREAEGLVELTREGTPRVPRPLLFGEKFILLEDLNPAPRREDYWVIFGRQLAALHDYTGPGYGFHHDNYIGKTLQLNNWMEDGYEFFAQQRLIFQARLANKKGLLPEEAMTKVERLAGKLVDLIPDQPASLIHGDLWTGNTMTDAMGEPVIIDPAVHYGWAEAELAMTTLFGTFPSIFYQAYQEVRRLEPGYGDRFPFYNLYHVLNHLNLFGTAYLGQVLEILRRS